MRDLVGIARLWRDDRFTLGTTPLATGVFYNLRGGYADVRLPGGEQLATGETLLLELPPGSGALECVVAQQLVGQHRYRLTIIDAQPD